MSFDIGGLEMKRVLMALVLGAFSIGANAALISRIGGTAYYDDILDVTWLTNMNYAMTSGYDDDGRMSWLQANDFIASLNNANFLGATGWRLPNANPVDGIAHDDMYADDGSTDVGFNISAPGTIYAGSKANEMAHLFHNTLGNSSWHDTSGNPNNCPTNSEGNVACWEYSGPFYNLSFSIYWSSSLVLWSGGPGTGIPNHALTFRFQAGDSSLGLIDNVGVQSKVIPVVSGDPFAAVPIPAAVYLFGSALGLLGWVRRGLS